MKPLVFTASLLLFLASQAAAQIIHVPGDYPTIQDGINAAATGDTVLVAPGTYFENLVLAGPNIILASHFLTTGDTSYISSTIIDGGQAGSVITVQDNIDSTTRISGFSITNGKANRRGGGIMIEETHPYLDHLKIFFNKAIGGGGICISKSRSVLDHLEVFGNSAEQIDNYSVEGGGGLLIRSSNSHIVIQNSLFTKNTSVASGGGIYCNYNHLVLQNVDIIDNTAQQGGGINFTGEYLEMDPVNRCNIHSNRAESGNDIRNSSYQLMEVYVDTFSVLMPTNFHVVDTSYYLFDILHGKLAQANADLYVSPSGHDSNSGLSADEPLKTIHTAFSKMLPFSGDTNTVFLAQGIYNLSVSDEFFPVNMLDYIRLEGDDREATILDAEASGTVIKIRNNAFNALSDFTIKGGSGDYGGGIYCHSDNVMLENLNITGNTAIDGGGIFSSYCEPVLEDCHIFENNAENKGGGIYLESSLWDYHYPLLDGVILHNNSATYGGGLAAYDLYPLLKGTSIYSNTGEYGGGIFNMAYMGFDSTDRCNIYLNTGIVGNDIFSNKTLHVRVDTFTVLQPTEFYASALELFDFDIQNYMLEQVEADLYVSPDGDNSNSGLTSDDPLKTIYHAQSIIIATEASQRHIHLLDGIYSPGTNGEFFPVNLMDYIDISGTADSLVILDADSTSRVMQIVQNDTNRITDLTLTGGYDERGAGMYIEESDPYLDGLVITQNSTTNDGSRSGGGIFCTAANPYMNDLRVTGNVAHQTGGGIFLNLGSMPLLKNSIISNNMAGSHGGGVSATNYNTVLYLESLTINGNISGSGAGIFNQGRLVLEDCLITGNDASGSGGGIRSWDTLWINNSEITDNRAQDGGGILLENQATAYLDTVEICNNLAYARGGGMFCGKNSTTYFYDALIKNNQSSAQGGGIYSSQNAYQGFQGTDITFNSAALSGGGIYWSTYSDPVFDSLDRCNIYLNNGGYGNDLFSSWDTFHIVVDTFTVLYPTDYHAEQRNKFAFDILAGKINQVDADLFVSATGNDSNTGLTPEEPLKTMDKAYQKLRSDSTHRHTVHLADGVYSPSTTGEKFPVRLINYSSLSGQSRNLTILDAEGSSSVLGLSYDTIPEILNMTITGGKAFSGAGIFSNTSKCNLFNIRITGNECDKDGGGLRSSNGTISLHDLVIDHNSAESGAGIYFSYMDSAFIDGCEFRANSALLNGGGIYAYKCDFFHITSAVLDSNQAENGGGIWTERTCSRLYNCLVTNNIATHFAGGMGLYDQYTGTCVESAGMYNTTFARNEPFALFCSSDNVRVVNSIFWDNPEPYQILINQTGSKKDTLTVEYSDIQAGMNGILVSGGAVLEWLDGNMEADPMFLLSGDHPYSLESGSPCLDAGTPDTTGLGLPLNDILGNTRIWDGDGNGTFIIDMGPYEYDAPVNVGEDIFPNEQSSNEILVYPNPARDNLKIILPGNPYGYSITLHNTQGQTIHSRHIEAGHENVSIPLKHLPAGLYMMIIRNEKGNTFTKKILLLY